APVISNSGTISAGSALSLNGNNSLTVSGAGNYTAGGALSLTGSGSGTVLNVTGGNFTASSGINFAGGTTGALIVSQSKLNGTVSATGASSSVTVGSGDLLLGTSSTSGGDLKFI